MSPTVKEKRRLSRPTSSILAGNDPGAELRPLITADMVQIGLLDLVDFSR